MRQCHAATLQNTTCTVPNPASCSHEPSSFKEAAPRMMPPKKPAKTVDATRPQELLQANCQKKSPIDPPPCQQEKQHAMLGALRKSSSQSLHRQMPKTFRVNSEGYQCKHRQLDQHPRHHPQVRVCARRLDSCYKSGPQNHQMGCSQARLSCAKLA